MSRTLVLGIGNVLMGDEGIGVHLVQHIKKYFELTDVEIIDGGTGGFHLLDYFLTYDTVVILDAIMDGKDPGTMLELLPKFSSDYPTTLTAHDVGLKDVLDSLYLLQKTPRIILFAVSINELDRVSLQLSDELQAKLQNIATRIVKKLETDYF